MALESTLGGPDGEPQGIKFAAPDISEQDIAAVAAVLRTAWITTGNECRELENELAAYLAVEHVVAMSSCTAALETAVAYLQLPPGSRVAVPTWTFVSTALCAVHQGLQPVLLDIEPDTLNLSPDALAEALDAGVDAVIGVHFGGSPLSKEIHRLCADANVPFVEDAAHALGATDHRGRVAGQGTAGACFSFYATKNLTSVEGGALATDDPALAEFAHSFRLHGLSRDAWARYHPDARTSGYDMVMPGIKGNLPDVLAVLARSQFARFSSMQARRRTIVCRYRDNLRDVPGLGFIPSNGIEGSADHLFVITLPARSDRDAVVGFLRDRSIGTSVHFQPLHHFAWFDRNATPGPRGLPVADAMANRVLSLPLHTSLTDGDVDRVSSALIDALKI